ncbi:hypothetical protein MASR2M78_34200 [Treponema sp.]
MSSTSVFPELATRVLVAPHGNDLVGASLRIGPKHKQSGPILIELDLDGSSRLVQAELGLHADSIEWDEGALSSESNLAIHLEEGSQASIILRYLGSESQVEKLYKSTLSIHLERDAHLECMLVSETGRGSIRDSIAKAHLGEKAVLKWTEAIFDQGDGRYITNVDLRGKGAELDFAGAYLAGAITEREHEVNENHFAPATKSRAVMKSVLRESAHLVFRGLIRVDATAPGTDAYLSNRNLLLDDGARAESLPQLRIETDDVACSHGSATGGPREEELFYLMSRGLDFATARSLLALGHLGSVLDRAPAKLAEELEARTASILEGKLS